MKVCGTILLFLVLCMAIGGCNRSSLGTNMMVTENISLSGPGIMWVLYDLAPFGHVYIEDDIPVPVVNDFLIGAGYTPKVLAVLRNADGTLIEVIHIGSDIDPSPLFPALQDLESVVFVALKMVMPDESEATPAF